MTHSSCRLYLITPPDLAADGVEDFVPVLSAALDGGGVASVQLRLMGGDENAIRRAAEILFPVVQDRDVAFLLHGHPGLAAELGCDGVHVDPEDTSYEVARRAVGPGGIVGVTCHGSRDLALQMAEKGADYVSFGPFFPPETQNAEDRVETEVLSWWDHATIVPSVAFGGIRVENCAPLAAAGAHFLAVSAGVWDYPAGPVQAVGDFNAAMEQAQGGDQGG